MCAWAIRGEVDGGGKRDEEEEVFEGVEEEEEGEEERERRVDLRREAEIRGVKGSWMWIKGGGQVVMSVVKFERRVS